MPAGTVAVTAVPFCVIVTGISMFIVPGVKFANMQPLLPSVIWTE